MDNRKVVNKRGPNVSIDTNESKQKLFLNANQTQYSLFLWYINLINCFCDNCLDENMKLKHEKSLLIPDNNLNISRIECFSIAPNLSRIAVCTSVNNQIVLFDGITNEEKDKFALKSMDKKFSRKSFVVKGIAFSPDSQKLAIGQTDCVIYVYKIGQNWY